MSTTSSDLPIPSKRLDVPAFKDFLKKYKEKPADHPWKGFFKKIKEFRREK